VTLTSRVQVGRAHSAFVVVAFLLLIGAMAPRAAAAVTIPSYCSELNLEVAAPWACQWCNSATFTCEVHRYNCAEGLQEFLRYSACHDQAWWDAWWVGPDSDVQTLCVELGQEHGVPAEKCANTVDEDCDGWDPPCSGCLNPTAPVGGTAACAGFSSSTWPGAFRNTGQCRDGAMTCQSNGAWGACAGAITPSAEVCTDNVDNDCNAILYNGCAEVCGDAQDNNGDSRIDEACVTPDPPAPTAPPGPTMGPASDSLREMNDNCPNEDWAGADPVQLAARSAATEPFADFEVAPLRRLAFTRSYASGAVVAGEPAGIFGLGWHHEWEATLACVPNGAVNAATCTVTTGHGERMTFAKQAATVSGVGALAGETLVLYRRSEPENLAAGGHNLLIRRPNGEFILFQLDGSELRFLQPSSCGSYCMDSNFNGRLRLSRDVDATGRTISLDFAAPGKLITLTDDLGNRVSLEPSTTCAARAGTLTYRPGTGATDTTYVTFTYDGTCNLLEKSVPANYTAAPNKTAQLRRYEYQSTPRAGLLTKVRNEFDDPVAVFGYDATTGEVTSLVDAASSLTISYPQPTQDRVVSAYGALQSTTTSYRWTGGKATAVSSQLGHASGWDEYSTVLDKKLTWNGRHLECSQERDRVRYFGRDARFRVTVQSDYGPTSCANAPWQSSAEPLRSTGFEYGLTRTIAQGVTLELTVVTRTWQRSVFATELAQGSGAPADTFRTSVTFDYDAASKAGDPSGYSCGTAGLPVGGLVCRSIEEGYTPDANGQPTLQKLATFYSYDVRGRLIRTDGPKYLVGQAPSQNVDPVEVRTYWPDDDPEPLKRGRLHDVKRYVTASFALTTSYELYDAFGPTRVVDPAGNPTIYTRVGGAGRVTRVDGPDGRHISTRFYDGDKPRLLLLNGGTARRFTYDDKGRLLTIQPLSGDPESGASVTVGWTETRAYDAAGNVTLLTRADGQGTIQWKESYEYYQNGALKKIVHPEGKGYARWTRGPDGVPERFWDEDLHMTDTATDWLKRLTSVTFAYWDGPANSSGTRRSIAGGYIYGYEPGQDALRGVWTRTALTTNGSYPIIAGYVHDDFGRLISVSSPYTIPNGPYVYAYDARGNVVKRTGGGAVIGYEYDGVDRVTKLTATRSADSQSFTYTYAYDDPEALGRLHSIIEADRTTTFTYDEVGRPLFENVAESGVAMPLTTEFRYDEDGFFSEVITPTGLDVKYERDAVTKDVTEVRNVDTGTKYASNVKHLPSGPITEFTFAGGQTLAQGFNARYEPIAISSGPLALSYTVSGSGLVTAIGQTTFAHDKRDRLERTTPLYTPPYTYVYPHDTTSTWYALNDRPQEVVDAAGKRKYAFGYDDGSSLSAVSLYDGTGTNITNTTCLVHDALGRLTAVGPAKAFAGPDARACRSESDLASVTVRFRYDARDRRVARQDGTGPWKHYVFTPDGQLLSEITKPSTSAGAWATQREYVWLDGRPLAQIEYPGPTAGEGYVYLVHVDHLGQPRALTSMASGATVWTASVPRPYGDMTEAPGIDPANGRTIATNLRLPGQYDEKLLGAVGLQGPFYNGARWYLPSMARYLELDPIALKGGLNGGLVPDWYGYGRANPVRWTDPTGMWAGIDDLVFTAGGALVGLAGQAVGDLMMGRLSSWQDYTGAAIGGAVTGEAMLYVGPVVGGALGAATGNATKQGLRYFTGKQCGFDAWSLLADTALGAAGGTVAGRLRPGINAGRNSYNAVFKQMVTKLRNGTISTVSAQTAVKMFIGGGVDQAFFEGIILSPLGSGVVAELP
jgi:RHS repeat-associated protein